MPLIPAGSVAHAYPSFLQGLLDYAQDAASVTSASGVILAGNDRLAELLGAPLGEIVGRPFSDFVPAEDREGTMRAWAARGSAPGFVAPEVRNLRVDGSEVFVDWSVRGVGSDPPVFLCLGHDVTARVRAERALRESEERFRSLIDGVREGFWVADADGDRRVIVYASSNAARILGTSLDELHADAGSWLGRIHPEDRARMELCFSRPDEEPRVFRVVDADGTVRHVEVRRRISSDGAGRPVRITGVLEDVTARVRAQAREQEMIEMQRLEAVSRLAGGIAHDFNNLLAVILTSVHFALENVPEAHEAREDLTEIRRAAERAAALTRQLLAYSRRQKLDPQVVETNAILADMTRLVQRTIGEDVELEVALSPDAGNIRVDPGQLEQVILNLVVNARDAMPEGGRLTIATGRVDDRVAIAVSDTGCGMDAETLRRAREPFFTTKPLGKGTGLGLATSDGIVRQSGGSLVLHSRSGAGTTVHILLPEVNEPVSRVVRAESGAPGGHERILVVEDQPNVRHAIVRTLSRMGYSTVEASTAAEAVRRSADYPGSLDLVVSDVVVPGGGAAAAAKEVCEKHGAACLFISGYVDEGSLSETRLPPGAPFLQKPFTPEDLAHKVREVLDARPTVRAPRPAGRAA